MTAVLEPFTPVIFEEHLPILARARADYDLAKADLDARRAAFDAEHAEQIARVADLKTALEVSEQQIRDAAVRFFDETGDKKPAPGVEIKLWDGVTYDPSAARTWCLVNMPALLVLNAAAYEKLFREVVSSKTLSSVIVGMPGLLITDSKASIARDLSQYLKDETT